MQSPQNQYETQDKYGINNKTFKFDCLRKCCSYVINLLDHTLKNHSKGPPTDEQAAQSEPCKTCVCPILWLSGHLPYVSHYTHWQPTVTAEFIHAVDLPDAEAKQPATRGDHTAPYTTPSCPWNVAMDESRLKSHYKDTNTQ